MVIIDKVKKVFSNAFELFIGDLSEEEKKELRKEFRLLLLKVAAAYAQSTINKKQG